jgi:hypothetical protein
MLNALEYALGIYALTLVITMIVFVLIIAIRWLSSERSPAKTTAAKT